MLRAKEYVKVKSLEEAYELNQKRANVVIGGMMWLKMSNGNRAKIIDLTELQLNKIEESEDSFEIGSMCTLRQLELHTGLKETFGTIFEACTKHIVGTQFRNGATVGGSVFGKFGFSDIITCLLMLDTSVNLYKAGSMPLGEFLERKSDRDILVSITIKKDGRVAAYGSQRQTKTDFPLIACGVAKKEDQYFVSIGARPKRAQLVTLNASDAINLSELAAIATEQVVYGSNLRGSGEYRKHIATIQVRRLMEELTKEEAKRGNSI